MAKLYICRKCGEIFKEEDIREKEYYVDCGYYGSQKAGYTGYEKHCPKCNDEDFEEFDPQKDLEDLIDIYSYEWCDDNDNLIVNLEVIEKEFKNKYKYFPNIETDKKGYLYIDIKTYEDEL